MLSFPTCATAVWEGVNSIGWILLLLSAVVYIYGILGVLLFRDNDPRNFRNLGKGIMSVTNVATGRAWWDVPACL